MTIQERTKDLIIQLKKVKEHDGLTNADILRMIEENGDNISMATVCRVMADGSENSNFRYRESIKPIAKAILGIDIEHLDGISDEERATKDIILLKEIEAREKDAKIERLEEQLKHAEADARRRIDFLKEQIASYQAEIVRKDSQIAARDSQIATRDASLRKKDEMIAEMTSNLMELIVKVQTEAKE